MTIARTVFFAVKLVVQFLAFREARVFALTLVKAILGWPATVLLLGLSDLYGLWRLGHLGSPSVAAFKADTEPPWMGQRRRF